MHTDPSLDFHCCPGHRKHYLIFWHFQIWYGWRCPFCSREWNFDCRPLPDSHTFETLIRTKGESDPPGRDRAEPAELLHQDPAAPPALDLQSQTNPEVHPGENRKSGTS
jgi:hypothetical protein